MSIRYEGEITIEKTTAEDLDDLLYLWNNGRVMQYVGFPEGLGAQREELDGWLEWVGQSARRSHYTVRAEGVGYCGEAFYDVDGERWAALDIKLLPDAWGKGIATRALGYAIGRAFGLGRAQVVYVDPHPDNGQALRLYSRLGFKPEERPAHLPPEEGCENHLFLTVHREDWLKD